MNVDGADAQNVRYQFNITGFPTIIYFEYVYLLLVVQRDGRRLCVGREGLGSVLHSRINFPGQKLHL